LPVDKLFGVGKVTARKLHQLGVETCADLRGWTMPQLQQQFGKFGADLYELCRGIDRRPVSPCRARKSISVEETYATDLRDLSACVRALPALLASLQQRIARAQAQPHICKLFVKIRFADFRRTTAECAGSALDAQQCRQLLEAAHRRSTRPVRLLGVGVRLQEEERRRQLGLFGEETTVVSE